MTVWNVFRTCIGGGRRLGQFGPCLLVAICWSVPGFAQEQRPADAVDRQDAPLFSQSAGADPDTRTTFPNYLTNSYFSVLFGSINYPFSTLQLEPGFRADRVDVPHTAVGLVLFGHRFHKYLSGQISYVRPVQYVRYGQVNGGTQDHAVSVAIGEISLKSQYALGRRLSIYGQTGVSIKTRRGFEIENRTVVEDTHVASLLLGTGLEYAVNNRWDLLAGLSYAGAHPRHREPETVFTSLGFRYNLRSQQGSQALPTKTPPFIFKEHVVQVGYTARGFGYGVNNLLSTKVPIFWGGDVRIGTGLSARYHRNVFHTPDLFSLDFGASFAYWSSLDAGNRFVTLSAYPVLRFTVWRRPSADYYVSYSLAGPTLISKTVIDQHDAGTRFTFQDMLGVGAFLRKNRDLVAEISIGHYSNGNLFAHNPGLKIPLTFSVGYAF